MDKIMFTRVTDGDETILFPVNRIDCVLRYDRADRDDVVRIVGDPCIYTCDDDKGTGKFENSLITFTGRIEK